MIPRSGKLVLGLGAAFVDFTRPGAGHLSCSNTLTRILLYMARYYPSRTYLAIK